MAGLIGDAFTSGLRGAQNARQEAILNKQQNADYDRKRASEEVEKQLRVDALRAFKDYTTKEVEDPQQQDQLGRPVVRPKSAAEMQASELKYQNSVLAIANFKDPVEGMKLQKSFEDKSAHKIMAKMYGVTNDIIANGDRQAFEGLNNMFKMVSKDEEVDVEASNFDPKTKMGVLVTRQTADPTRIRTRPITPQTMRAMFLTTVTDPKILGDFADAEKKLSEAGIAGQKEGAGYGLRETEKIQAETGLAGAQTTATEFHGKLYKSQAEMEQKLIELGYPQAKVKEMTAAANMHNASAARSRALSAGGEGGGEGGLKGANAQLRRLQVADSMLGVRKQSEIDGAYFKTRKAMQDDLASPEALKNLETEYQDTKAMNSRLTGTRPYVAGILQVNPNLQPVEAIAVGTEIYEADRISREKLAELSKGGKKPTTEDRQAMLGLVLGDRIHIKNGERYYKVGNVSIKLPQIQ